MELDDYLANIVSRYLGPMRGKFIIVEIVVKADGLKGRIW